jgi:MFS family permease
MTGAFSWVADSWGPRRVLVISALLMAASGAVFATSTNLVVLVVAAALGTLSPSGSEVGPFLHRASDAAADHAAGAASKAFSVYNVVGQSVAAFDSGAAASPALVGVEPLAGYRALM